MAKTAQPVNPWTFKKLDILEEYLAAYVTATKKAWGQGIHYIDLFAGCGENEDKRTGTKRKGSPLLALGLQPGFHGYHFVEEKKEYLESLREHIAEYPVEIQRRVKIYPGDCNSEVNQVLTNIPQESPTFAFLDPYATELHWATIERLALHKRPPGNKIELFILFSYNMALVRLLARDTELADTRGFLQVVERVMPTNSNWRTKYEDRAFGVITQHELRRKFVEDYLKGLESLGYKHVPPPYLMRSDNRRPLYFLFFATDHPAGVRIMESRFRKPREGQQTSYWDYFEEY
ncbi:three-Cys-motif partner protein TcmP [Chloroflexota bacterium]